MGVFDGFRITSGFGTRTSPITGIPEWHTGIDLVKAHQAKIYAFMGGVVFFAGEGKTGSGLGGYGNVVAIENKGFLHVYAHLDSVDVRVGQFILRDTLIGRQGTTGKSTGSHLHYEIRFKTTPSFGYNAIKKNMCIDPTIYLEAELKKLDMPKDIKGHWAEEKIKKVIADGKMKGYPDGSFKPNEPLTRAELASLIADGKI